MLTHRVERMCKYIFKCVRVCVCFLPVPPHPPPPHIFPLCSGGRGVLVGLLSRCAVSPSADQYVPVFFSSRGEDAADSKCRQTAWRSQRVGTSLISNFLPFPFPKLWIWGVEGGDHFHRHKTTPPVLSWRRHDTQTHRHPLTAGRRLPPHTIASQ